MSRKVIIERLSDEVIDQLSKNRVIITDKDFNLKRNSQYEKNRLYPEVGGVYDSDFFGSIYSDSCNCGRINSVGTLCQKCGSRVLSEEEKYNRYARIDLDFYYVMSTKVDALLSLLLDLPLNLEEAKNFFEFSRLSKSSVFYVTELCQFNWDEELQEIDVTPFITDESKSSYEGLELILKDKFPDLFSNFKSIVNKKVLVAPAVYRMATFNPYELTKLSIPFLSSIYQSIVKLKYDTQEMLNEMYFDPMERVACKAIMRRYVSKHINSTSEILKPSKQNAMRMLFSARIDNSGRAPIVGDPKLAIDEVRLPIHLAYEVCKLDFINYLSETLEVNLIKAELLYKRADEETLNIFREYAPTRRVIINRPPSLHRYNNMSFKMYVTDDQAIHFPITSVEPFAADFDGDAVSFYLVPSEFDKLCDDNASPATQKYYESTGDFIWKPNQDMLYGLTLATRVRFDNSDELVKYASYEDMTKDYDAQVLQFPTDVVLLNGKPTTLARETVSKIIRRPIDDFYPDSFINAGNIGLLLSYIYSLEDFTKVYQELVEYGLEVLTIEGATVPSLTEMISVDYSEYTAKMKELIVKSSTDPKYFIELESEYKKFVEDQVNNLSEDLSRRIKDSGRMKMQQVVDMMIPQMMVNPVTNEYYVADNSLANGLSREDYVRHAFNNRSILQQKQLVTPNSGYCNRQLIQGGQGIRMSRKIDTSPNEGVWIPRNKAEGRTTVDNEKLGPSDSTEMVLVRSFAMSRNREITPDVISEVNTEFPEGSNVGLRFIGSISGGITQQALSLKHNGTLLSIDPHLVLRAKEDCKVTRINSDLIRIKPSKGKAYDHYVPNDFKLYTASGSVNKGDIIGFLPRFIDPGYRSRVIIDLLGATSTEDISAGGRDKNFSLCVTPQGGTIHYDQGYVYVDNLAIPRDPNRLYYNFEGDKVDQYSIICDGTLDCYNIRSYCSTNRDYYGCFRTFFLSLMPKIQEHIVEYLFSTINVRDDSGDLVFTGVKSKVKQDKSILTNLGYEGASKLIRQTLVQPEVQDKINESEDLFAHFYLEILSKHL